jgi:GNAT superfamily N-acetyltransferase
MAFALRPYHPSDLPALYRICLLTGDSGQDASALYRDPELLGHVYAAPYAHFEPDLCFTLTLHGAPVGYVLGARDTAAFEARCEREWLPALRARYAMPASEDQSPDAGMIRGLHEAHAPHPNDSAYPAHLHIDLLPPAQGQGNGRRMIETLLAKLRALGVPGVHLGVGARNSGAISFYERVGFAQLKEWPWGYTYGMLLARTQEARS